MTTIGPTTISVVSPMTLWNVGAHQFGVAILEESFRWAAVGLCGATTTTRQVQRINAAISFINGTALDVTLETFGIDLNADRLREAFEAWVKQQTTPYSR